VACLAAYNNGQLHGAWIWAEDADDMQAATRKMLAASPETDAEEWAIHDYAGFEGLRLSEYQSFESVADMAAFIEEHEELGAKTAEHFGGNLDEARTALTENYAGKYESLAEFAQGFFEDCGTEIPPAFRNYIDWAALGRDISLNGDITVIEMGHNVRHIFWAR
jgi:antirestriction protein